MKRYCAVNVIKEDCLDEYIQAHTNPWPEVLESINKAGVKEELIYIYKNYAILFIECEDIQSYIEEFGNSETGKKWLKKMSFLLAESDFADESGNAQDVQNGLMKVFDLRQQLSGKLSQE